MEIELKNLEIEKLKKELEIQKELYKKEIEYFKQYKDLHSIPNYQFFILKLNYEKVLNQTKFDGFEKEILKNKAEKKVKLPSPIKRVFESDFEETPKKKKKSKQKIEDKLTKSPIKKVVIFEEKQKENIKETPFSPKHIQDYETKKTKKSIFSFNKLLNVGKSSIPTLKKVKM